MQNTVFLIVCAVGSLAASLVLTVFYKQIRDRFWKNKYKLPDKIPLLEELESIPDKNKFIQSSYLLNNGSTAEETTASVVDALITDESALHSGFSLQGENILLECISPKRTTWHEISSFPAIIGKSEDCDIQLADDNKVNDRHGIFLSKGGQYFYLDMNSIGGSQVDNMLAEGIIPLRNGICIQVCQTTVRLVFQSNIQ